MITFKYDGVDFANRLIVHDIRGRSIAPSDVETIETPGRRGARFRRKKYLTRLIELDVTLQGTSSADLREKIDELTVLLDKETPRTLVFSDEPDKTYYAILTGEPVEDNIRNFEQFSLMFICPDPLKYGPEAIQDITGGKTFKVGGTSPTKPITEVTLTAPTTFVAISNGEDVNMLGEYVEADKTPYQRNVQVINDAMSTTTGWGATTTQEDGIIAGSIKTEGGSFKPASFGTGAEWHGPALKRPLSTSLQDFRIEVDMSNTGGTTKNVGSVQIALLDAANQIVAKIVVIKSKSADKRTWVHIKAGKKTTGKVVYQGYGPSARWPWEHFSGKIIVERVGNQWFARAARWSQAEGYNSSSEGRTIDTKLEAAAPITQVQVNFWQHGTKAVPNMSVENIRVFRVQERPEEIPYIAEAGDQITFDHVSGRVYKNGLDVTDEVAFISKNFELAPGTQTIVAEPEEGISNTIVRWRNTWR